jgi:Uma2 family endonuclease
MHPARRRATYADLVEVPDHMVAEIVDGDLYTAPRPASPHATAASVIGGDLNGAFHRPADGPGRPGGWWILDEPELHLGPDVIVPDLAGWRRERMPVLSDVAYFDLAPDWACEVVSPATGALDRTRKMPIYAREGVGHLWLVDPISRTLEIYNLNASRWVVVSTHGGKEAVRAAPFDAIELDIGRWWLD